MSIKLYPLRNDLSITQMTQDEQEIVVIGDPLGYSDSQIAVSLEFFWLLTQIEKGTTAVELAKKISLEQVEYLDPFFAEVEKLNELKFMDSPSFNQFKKTADAEFLANPIRESVLTGHSFPEDKEEFKNYLDTIFELVDKNEIDGNAKAAIIPHLDLITGEKTQKVYAKGYHSLRENDFDLIVIFGTAHFKASHRFMLIQKHFETPNGIIETDLELINSIKEIAPDSFIIDEYAHRQEHSIEIQVALSSHYFNGRKFKILPVLTAGYFDLMEMESNPDNDETIKTFISTLNDSLNKLGRNAIYIASVDFSHYGAKFQDDFDAKDKIEESIKYDEGLMKSILENDHNNFYKQINDVDDDWKVCGTAPIFTLLKSQENKKPKFLDYQVWYEPETQSAVSCAAISFYN